MDTGLTIDKVKFISNKEFSRRRDEIHFRLSKTELYSLYCEYEQEENEDIIDTDSNIGGGPRIVSYSELSTPQYAKPYLIFDVREPDEFNKGHLRQARNYPYTMMRRDQMHPEFYSFRNKEGCLIIICCDDERISADAAKLLVQRGTDNIFLLTGGIQEFVVDYSAYVEGVVPLPPNAHATARKGIYSVQSNFNPIPHFKL